MKMNTLHLTNSQQDIATAAAVLRDGGLVAMPTETVYGLAANALDGNAVRRIFEAKGRPMDNPLIVHIAEIADIERLGLVREFPETARKLAEAFWPGPLTIIMDKGSVIPDEVSAGLSTVAIRLPSHPDARRLIRESGLPLAAPSANTSGKPSPTTAQHVIDDMDGRIEAVIDGGACDVGVESTVITVATDIPRILRPGIITREEIAAVIGDVEVDKAVLNKLENNERASSPGMKYKHYAPRATVILVRGTDEKFIGFVNRCQKRDGNVAALCYTEDIGKIDAPVISLGSENDQKQQAQALFDALRAVDEIDGVEVVYAHCPSADGVGMALYNRLIRAAAFRVIDLPDKRIIGLSGQTGAGKSEVAGMLRELGAGIVSADVAAREAVEEADVKAALCAAFGDVLNPDRSLNRARVARIAFSSEKNLKTLNSITHPRIVEIMLRKAAECEQDIVIFDAPQLFEAHADVFCEKIICVLSDREKRLERIVRRDNLVKEEAELRMSVQFDERFFIDRSDSIIYNNGSVEELRARVKEVYGGLSDG
ncbi:MAG: threonylcarbamoyl-AMP synthase [Ruminococcus sp.]|nr:threonylcarbamoyl-AMP synthase [Ruminococcus sp.]